jgi:argininosuccinate lyase
VAPLFEVCRSLAASLAVLTGLIDRLHVDEARMRNAAEQGFGTAVAVADRLVELGVAFRAAHHILGALVRTAEARGVGLAALDDAELAATLAGSDDTLARELAADPSVPADLRAASTIDAALARPDVIGGTAPGRVAAELAEVARRLGLD